MPLPFGPEPPVEPRPRHARQGDDTRRPDPARGEARRWPTGRDVRRGLGLLKIDRKAGEVWIQGRRVRLQEQPYRVLLALVDAPGETVTREELCARLWPAQTYVDFDNGLNNIVSRLRAALGDATQWPCFIETVGRRGYRFIGDALFMSPAIRPGGRTDRPAAGRVTPAAAASADRGASPAHPGAGGYQAPGRGSATCPSGRSRHTGRMETCWPIASRAPSCVRWADPTLRPRWAPASPMGEPCARGRGRATTPQVTATRALTPS